LLESLRQQEYSGYDSAGIGRVNSEKQLSCLQADDVLVNLTQHHPLLA